MKRIRSKGSQIERAFSRILRYHGISYKLHPKHAFGNPDFQIAGSNILVFCDSSFWHGRHFSRFAKDSFGTNKALWFEKLRRNMRRDKIVTRRLRRSGYRVFRAWDDDILRSPNSVVDRLAALLAGPA